MWSLEFRIGFARGESCFRELFCLFVIVFIGGTLIVIYICVGDLLRVFDMKVCF